MRGKNHQVPCVPQRGLAVFISNVFSAHLRVFNYLLTHLRGAQPSRRISKIMSLNYFVFFFPLPSLFCGNIESNPGPDALDDTRQVMANN